jgi:hypothetical protein
MKATDSIYASGLLLVGLAAGCDHPNVPVEPLSIPSWNANVTQEDLDRNYESIEAAIAALGFPEIRMDRAVVAFAGNQVHEEAGV